VCVYACVCVEKSGRSGPCYPFPHLDESYRQVKVDLVASPQRGSHEEAHRQQLRSELRMKGWVHQTVGRGDAPLSCLPSPTLVAQKWKVTAASAGKIRRTRQQTHESNPLETMPIVDTVIGYLNFKSTMMYLGCPIKLSECPCRCAACMRCCRASIDPDPPPLCLQSRPLTC
jgi:hypothetical protein